MVDLCQLIKLVDNYRLTIGFTVDIYIYISDGVVNQLIIGWPS
jgi:hypothetical protein